MTSTRGTESQPRMPTPCTLLVAADGRELPLRAVDIRARARGGYARVVLEQRFVNDFDETLRVTYSVPLPVDGAVSGFSFTIAGRRTVGAIESRDRARQRFEEALVEGRTAALLEQDRSSLFTQDVGNVPPRAEIRVEITIDQPLRWLDDGLWEWRFPTVVGPRYAGGPARTPDAARLAGPVLELPPPVAVGLCLDVLDDVPEGRVPGSPSHALRATPAAGMHRVSGSERPIALDRDVVVQWPISRERAATTIEVGRLDDGNDDAFGLVTIVPPERSIPAVARDLVVLIDTSGSMFGTPLHCAQRVVSSLIENLAESDTLELVQFASKPTRWKAEPVLATTAARRDALAWLRTMHAGGGTEMRDGIVEALRPRRSSTQRQVVLVTDGLIGFEREVIAAIASELESGARVHTVGIGSAVNRSLTAPAARAGRGVEVLVGCDDDVEPAVGRLGARLRAPLVTGLTVSGSAVLEVAPDRLPDLYQGAPVRIAARLRAAGGDLVVRGSTSSGVWEDRLLIRSLSRGEGPAHHAALFAREHVEDLEMRLAAGGDRATLEAEIERTGIRFGVTTRLTSWLAIDDDVTVDPQAPARLERMPHAIPYGMSAEALGLRAATPMVMADLDLRGAFDGAVPRQALDSSRARAQAAPAPLTMGRAPGGSPAPSRPGWPAPPASRTGAPPPPPAAAAPRPAPTTAPPLPSKGVLRRIREALGGRAGELADRTTRTLRGRISNRAKRRVWIEVVVDDGGPLDWTPDATGIAGGQGGEGNPFVIARDESTAPGTVASGQALRIVVETDLEDSISWIRIALPSCTLLVELR